MNLVLCLELESYPSPTGAVKTETYVRVLPSKERGLEWVAERKKRQANSAHGFIWQMWFLGEKIPIPD